MRYLDPKNDLVFKKIFGNYPNLLINFLNSLLPIAQPIKSIEYLPTELVPEIPLFKDTIVDVRCTDTQGRQFIVEMQMLWTESFKSRVLFNASKAYVRQLERGDQYRIAQPVYALSLVNQTYEHQMREWYHHYQIVEVGHPEKQIHGLEFVFIELPKFSADDIKDKKLMVLWLRFMSEIKDGMEQISKDFEEVAELKQAIELLQESAFSKEELEVYDRYWDRVSREKSMMMDKFEEGVKEGIDLERRIQEQKRKEEIQASIAKLKNLGMTPAQIAEILGIDENEF